jgi:hypothetical protein
MVAPSELPRRTGTDYYFIG